MSKQMDFISNLKLEHQSQLENPTLIQQNASKAASVGADPYWLTRDFHYAFDLNLPPRPVLNPTVSERLLRAKLIFEEFQELLEAMGLCLRVQAGAQMMNQDVTHELFIDHIEGSRYDPVETADALGDLNVVVNGTGLTLGLPMPFVNVEIWLSNMSKLDRDGNPIVNQCKHFGGDKRIPMVSPQEGQDAMDVEVCTNRERTNNCDEASHFINPAQPKGKILKSPDYAKPNITRIIYDHLEEESK